MVLNLNVSNNNGYTPLHNASTHGHDKCVDLLIKAGANPNVCNKYGYTPLHNASLDMRNKDMCRVLLLKAGANPKC
jgi:ankyrin repeat protein